ncbi:MAG: hypothetical protein K9J27_09890 [Bacteroidales bacterium]|nr:hypothetical protein [Bacteroidales bacterium]MCF8334165.1 hypothetical protein [Bacteroidales bacterium]
MLNLDIPGFKKLNVKNLVLDFNGTIACDGTINEDIKKKLNEIAGLLNIYVLTADTFGSAKKELEGVNCKLVILDETDQAAQKTQLVEEINPLHSIAIGNGRNDVRMLNVSAIGISVINEEGASGQTLTSADIVCRSFMEAMEMLENPRRIKATLRT